MGPWLQLYLHLVWATWDRLPIITPDVESRLYAALAAKARQLSCEPLAIGGVADHVHLLVRLPATVTVALLVKELKGASSHLVTHDVAPGTGFRWQGGYGAFTLARREVSLARQYIADQQRHHAAGTTQGVWEQMTAPEEPSPAVAPNLPSPCSGRATPAQPPLHPIAALSVCCSRSCRRAVAATVAEEGA